MFKKHIHNLKKIEGTMYCIECDYHFDFKCLHKWERKESYKKVCKLTEAKADITLLECTKCGEHKTIPEI